MSERRVIIVTGGRDFLNKEVVEKTLSKLRPDAIAHGGAPGADFLANHWAWLNRVECYVFPAYWSKHGRAAGPLRNVKMLDTFPHALVVAFPGGHGTNNCKAEARKRGMQVIEVNE